MKTGNMFLASCVVIVLSTGIAQAGPCNTANKDAGSGPTVGNTSQTTGAAPSRDTAHPPTSTNRAAGDVATSSQDAQRQMQGKPTAAREAQGAKVADEGC